MKLRAIVTETKSTLPRILHQLRPQLAAAAQEIYDDWNEDDDGGICDQIAEAIANIIADAGIAVTKGGHDGDDHAYIIAYDDASSYLVDIPYHLYERGGGYSWTKVPGVIFQPNDIIIEPTYRPDWI